MDQLVQTGHLKEFVGQEKTRVEEIEIKPILRFALDKEDAGNALDENLPIKTIHMMGGPHDPEFENRIRGRSALSDK